MKPDNWMPASGARMSWDEMQPESEPEARSSEMVRTQIREPERQITAIDDEIKNVPKPLDRKP